MRTAALKRRTTLTPAVETLSLPRLCECLCRPDGTRVDIPTYPALRLRLRAGLSYSVPRSGTGAEAVRTWPLTQGTQQPQRTAGLSTRTEVLARGDHGIPVRLLQRVILSGTRSQRDRVESKNPYRARKHRYRYRGPSTPAVKFGPPPLRMTAIIGSIRCTLPMAMHC